MLSGNLPSGARFWYKNYPLLKLIETKEKNKIYFNLKSFLSATANNLYNVYNNSYNNNYLFDIFLCLQRCL